MVPFTYNLGRLGQMDWHELPGQNGLHCGNLVKKKIKNSSKEKKYIESMLVLPCKCYSFDNSVKYEPERRE